jgi:excisionase family DNA binding protein
VLPESQRILEGHVSAAEILAYIQSDGFMTKQTAARFIDHKDTRKIERAIRDGHLRAFRCGRKILVRKSDLIAWIESNQITPAKTKAHKTALQNLTDKALSQARANVKAGRTMEHK